MNALLRTDGVAKAFGGVQALNGASIEVAHSGIAGLIGPNGSGKTILLVEQNARAGLRLSTHGVVLENGRVRLQGTGREVLEHPEIGALYLGGAIAADNGSGSGANTAGPNGQPGTGENAGRGS